MSLAGECSWELLHACNYRCPYCFFLPSWERAPEATNRKHHAVSAASWLAFWRRLRERRGEFLVEVSGGEPFVYEGAPALLAEVSRLHRLRVITNLSWEPALAAGLDPARVSFVASFHPDCAEPAGFEARLDALSAAGFEAAVMLVAYPPRLPELAALAGRFRSKGFETVLSPFQGAHEGRLYPRDYGPEARALLRGEGRAPLGLGEESPAGRLCGAGSRYFRAYPDGSLWRCVSVKDLAGARPLGHVDDPGLPLAQGPAPCPAAACLCPAEYRQLEPAEAA